jgi:hypothetical protein
MDTSDYTVAATRNPSGIGRRIYIKEIEKFDTIATPPASPTNPGDGVIITDDHTFPADPGTDGWQILYVHEDTPEIMTEQVGENGTRTLNCEINAIHPNWNPALEEETSVDKSYIVLVERLCDGATIKRFQMGTECLGAKMVSAMKSGKTREGGTFGHEVKITSTQAALYEYQGAVTRPSA